MTVFLILSVLALIATLAELAYVQLVKVPRLRRQERDQANEADYWRAKAANQAEWDQSRIKNALDGKDRNFERAQAMASRLRQLMGFVHYVKAILGPSGVLIQQQWNTLPEEQRTYYLQRGAERVAQGDDLDITSPKTPETPEANHAANAA